MLTKVFCCDIFTELLNEAGNKGFSIISVEYQDTYRFFLQSRNLDYRDHKDKSFSIAQRSINFCPWCGADLSEVIANNIHDISAFSKKNSYLFI
jgi:hypothetical protein